MILEAASHWTSVLPRGLGIAGIAIALGRSTLSATI